MWLGLKTLISVLFVFACSGSVAQAQTHSHAIEEVKPNLYRYTAGPYHSMFWVTDDGIVLIDTISEDAANWLKPELEKRFDVPVRYVIYSHSHYDHAFGGKVFEDPSVTFISHDLARQNLIMSKADTAIPQIGFTDEFSLTLGGETLTLRYHGPNNGLGSVSMLFEAQKVLFVVDWIVVGRMPWTNLEGYDIEGMIRSTRDVLSLSGWDTFVGGHADIGDRTDVEHYLGYITALYEAVRDGMIAGKSLETLQAEIKLEEYADLKNYEAWLKDNIGGVYRILADQSYMLKRPEIAAK